MLDFMSQLISDSMGHRHPAIHAELARAMERYGHVYFGMANEYRARAAKLIIEDLLGEAGWAGRARVFASGTDAVESCIAMARLYTGKSVILTQAHSFHGMVMGSTMMRGYRGNISPAGENFNQVQDIPGFPAHGYIPIPAPEFEDWQGAGRLPSLEATEQIVSAIGGGNIAAVITEPMLGGGGTFPHRDYTAGLRDISKRHGFLWIDDEVICGVGRLGEWFGYMNWPGVEPDLIAAGKRAERLGIAGRRGHRQQGNFRAFRGRALVERQHLGRPSAGVRHHCRQSRIHAGQQHAATSAPARRLS